MPSATPAPTQLKWISDFIWQIADNRLRDVYVRGKYRDVILPFTVLRRLDAVLEESKQAVLEQKQRLDKAGIFNQDGALRAAAGQAFYNISPFTLKTLAASSQAQTLREDFTAWLDGFSSNVQDILSSFHFRGQIQKLVDAHILGYLIEDFLNPDVNLAPHPVRNSNGIIQLPALDNHGMGTVFEELIRRFNEDNNEEAGEHFTPRDVVSLMAQLLFLPVADKIQSTSYTLYDGACGTGGMLTVAEDTLKNLAAQHGKQVSIHLFGQEINDETWAICTADLLLKGEGEQATNIKNGSTLAEDHWRAHTFDFMISNPPYGKSWKTDLTRMGGKEALRDTRFIVNHAGDPEYSLLTRSSDGQLLFLVNKLQKMKHATALGSRIAVVHNGSALFTGDAGQGESNIRRWILENDWLEAIIALPLNIFYNTGIATYIWVLANKKAPPRKGKVQLIDASQWFAPLRRNLGKKNCELGEADIARILDLYLNKTQHNTDTSKWFDTQNFGYWKITVERPLCLKIQLSDERIACLSGNARELAQLAQKELGSAVFNDHNVFKTQFDALLKQHEKKCSAANKKALFKAISWQDETAAPVIAKRSKLKKNDHFEPAFDGAYLETDGKDRWMVKYEPDTALRDTEQVPLNEPGGIEAFFQREVLPHTPDAWIAADKTQIGYEISFARYFYQPAPLRSLDDIRADILKLEQESEGLLRQIVGNG